jgi:hypothetical protein
MGAWLQKHATSLALVAAIIAFVASAFLIVSSAGGPGSPTATTTVTQSGRSRQRPVQKRTLEITRGPDGKARTITRVREGEPPASPKKTTTTVEEGERTFIERILGDGGLQILQWALALVGAFLVGALVQKILLGDYSFKFGSLEIAATAAASAKGLEDLNTSLSAKVTAVETANAEGEVKMLENLEIAYRRIELLEEEIQDLKSQ